jgi:hypothetical protein
MKMSFANFGRRRTNNASTGVVVLVSIALLAAVVLVLYLVLPRGNNTTGTTRQGLFSPATTNVLQQLDSPVEVRLYAVLDTDTVDPALLSFTERLQQMLNSYRDVSKGRVSITVFGGLNDSNTAAALADGMRPFNLDKGDASFLGVVVQAGSHKEVLPILNPDYEAALEADITRAMTRAVEAGRTQPTWEQSSEPDPAITESVKVTVPNYESIPLEAGTRMLRESMLVELQRAGEENEARIAQAQTALQQARESGTQAQQEAARKALSAAEREHANRLQEIVTKSTAQIRALEKLKTATP